MTKYRVRIVKAAEIEVEAESIAHAEQIGRDQEADAIVSFDTEVSASPVSIGGKPMAYWEQLLNGLFDVQVYESPEIAGRFGFTGCDSDDYESRNAAIEAAVLAHCIVEISAVNNPALPSA